MGRPITVFLVALVVASLASVQSFSYSGDVLAKWADFKSVHQKEYSKEEEHYRLLIFMDNLKLIESHNEKYEKGIVTFSMKIGKFADLLNTEYQRKIKCFIDKKKEAPDNQQNIKSKFNTNMTVPDEKNWVTEGAVTPVKDQGECGSCYAFSATGAIEGQQFITTGQLIPLSEQNLVDCSVAVGNQGCGGGTPYLAKQYVILNVGINRGEDYAYSGVQDPICRFNNTKPLAFIGNVGVVIAGDEQNLKETVALFGPVSVGIDAAQPSFQHYETGVYNEPACTQLPVHAVLVVGYGKENGQDYWLVKNSWGDGPAGFGDNGYIKMARNLGNQCGIASVATYPY